MAAGITPPGSVVEPPLTPPPLTPPPTGEKPLSKRVQPVVDLLRRRREGRLAPWVVCSLSPDEYAQLLLALDSDKNLRSFVERKVAYDYDPYKSRLTIRMPSPLHETFCAELVSEISSQLKVLQTGDGPLAEFARKIKHFASSRIDLPEVMDDGETKFSRREPDASFGHHQAHYPGVIIEVCYSQKSREIPYLADDYILNTDGNVKVVVGLDIDYKMSQRARLSVWRPEYLMKDGELEFQTTAVVEAEAFRTERGDPVTETALRLTLRDFAPDRLTQGCPDLDREIIVSSEQLCGFLAAAEARQQVGAQHTGCMDSIRPGALKRRRYRTPPEEISDGEASCEERKSKRDRRDSDYRPRASESDD